MVLEAIARGKHPAKKARRSVIEESSSEDDKEAAGKLL